MRGKGAERLSGTVRWGQVMAQDEAKREVMQRVLDGAAAVVAFSRQMLSTMHERMTFAGPSFIMPQAALVPPPPPPVATRPDPLARLGLPAGYPLRAPRPRPVATASCAHGGMRAQAPSATPCP